MKSILSCFLALSFASSAVFNAFVVADYFAHYNYYDTVLCVNKANPELKCHGTCHLKAALQQEQDTKRLPALHNFEFKANPVAATLKIIVPCFSETTTQNFANFDFDIANPWHKNCFHPPEQYVLA